MGMREDSTGREWGQKIMSRKQEWKRKGACVTSMIFNLRREYFIYMKNQGEDGKNKPTQEKWKTESIIGQLSER